MWMVTIELIQFLRRRWRWRGSDAGAGSGVSPRPRQRPSITPRSTHMPGSAAHLHGVQRQRGEYNVTLTLSPAHGGTVHGEHDCESEDWGGSHTNRVSAAMLQYHQIKRTHRTCLNMLIYLQEYHFTFKIFTCCNKREFKINVSLFVSTQTFRFGCEKFVWFPVLLFFNGF